ncbi:hypothetical protein ACNOYE_15835 [Nannocystaceae bacterium ST9]
MIAQAPWDLSPHLPWQHFMSPLDKWATQPSFVVGEYMFYVCTLLALIHAKREGREHLLIWFAALIAGTANDMIFMAMPLVDNFWQAQATIMITPRLPLYIPCVYVCFMYYPTVAVRRLKLAPLPLAALTGLVACMFYAPYDIVGAKFSWWTWHDTDAPIATRILGAPIGSSLWVLTFVGTFAWLLDRGIARNPALPAKTFALSFALVAGCTTILMVLQLTILQQLDGGSPGYFALAAGLAIYAGIVIAKWKTGKPLPEQPNDRLLHGAVIGYFVTLVSIMAVFDPATHVNTGVHQTVGECYVEAKDIAGKVRYEYLCTSDFDEDYTFECVDTPPAEGSEWYTVCGKAHDNFALWLAGVGLLGGLGIAVFSYLLGPLRRRRSI